MTGAPVLLIGVPSEPPMRMVADELARLGVAHLLWNQRLVHLTEVELTVEGGIARGVVEVEGVSWPLEDFEGVFLRLADVAEQPELAGLDLDHPRMVHADAVCELLLTWCDVTEARVVNRLRGMASNASKPHQLQAIAEVFATPDTLVTNDPSRVLAFWEKHRRAIYKSTSGARSIVQELGDADLERLARVAHCPTQFQAYVEGVDVRVHTLADGSAFATVIDSEATDYRYAGRSGASAAMHEVTLADDTVDACLRLAARLGLDFAGIDLRIAPDGTVYCFEVNPSPAYSAFEAETGQLIALGLARYLAGMARI